MLLMPLMFANKSSLFDSSASHWRQALQASESHLDEARKRSAEAEQELAEEKRKGAVRERKLLDRTHELSKVREQLQDTEVHHQAS